MSLLLLLIGGTSVDEGVDPENTLSKGGGGLWEAYQAEILQRLAPKSEQREPWQPPEKVKRTLPRTMMSPAIPDGMFDNASPEEARAIAEARARQMALNTKIISDLLRKARR